MPVSSPQTGRFSLGFLLLAYGLECCDDCKLGGRITPNMKVLVDLCLLASRCGCCSGRGAGGCVVENLNVLLGPESVGSF